MTLAFFSLNPSVLTFSSFTLFFSSFILLTRPFLLFKTFCSQALVFSLFLLFLSPEFALALTSGIYKSQSSKAYSPSKAKAFHFKQHIQSYKKADTNPKHFCKTWKKLSLEKNFPLYKLAMAKRVIHCKINLPKDLEVKQWVEDLNQKPEKLFDITHKWQKALEKIKSTSKLETKRQLIVKALLSESFPFKWKKKLRPLLFQAYQVRGEKHWKEKLKLVAKTNPKVMNYYYTHQIEQAKGLWAKEHNQKAKKFLKNLTTQKIPNFYSAWAHLILGLVLQEEGHFHKAIQPLQSGLKLLVKNKKPTTNSLYLRERMEWNLGWVLRKVNQPQKALAHFEYLARLKNPKAHISKYLFWHAQTLKDSGKSLQANKVLEELAKSHQSYYGFLAAYNLGYRKISLKEKTRFLTSFSTPKPISHKQKVSWSLLKELGEWDVLKIRLTRAEKTYRKKERVTASGWREILEWRLSLRQYLNIFAAWSLMKKDVKAQFLAEYKNFLYPLAFSNIIEKNAQKFDVPSNLILSLIRQESAFNPKARSVAGARGLMQLVPLKAWELFKKHHKKYNILYPNKKSLFDPKTNVALGSAYLKDLNTKYQGHLISMVAAYNSHPTKVKYWYKSRYSGNILEFVEDIPYRETRSYIKLLFRNYVFYSSRDKKYELSLEPVKDWLSPPPLSKILPVGQKSVSLNLKRKSTL